MIMLKTENALAGGPSNLVGEGFVLGPLRYKNLLHGRGLE